MIEFIESIMKEKANQMIWVGLILNLWIVNIIWLDEILSGTKVLDPQSQQLI